jgi:RHH-type proline utilization regulon transcriptional repressor/proline dehydrogenase/delta 1-pyrroline-5-carboxylate dehydrogenase
MTLHYPDYYARNESACVEDLLARLDWDAGRAKRVEKQAWELVEALRARPGRSGELEHFLLTYELDTREGLALMCLAEAYLRVPDAATANALIHDKVARAEWLKNDGRVQDWLVRAAGYGLNITQKTMDNVLGKIGAPFIRQAFHRAMRVMGREFVLGEGIETALKRAREDHKRGLSFSFDMLGEGARTAEDARSYYERYEHAIHVIGQNSQKQAKGHARDGISVKLSALYPRYEYAHMDACVPVLLKRLHRLCALCADYNIGLSVDAEECARLEPSLAVIRQVSAMDDLQNWQGLGLAVQAYQKRALPLLDYLADMAREHGRHLPVRLVKGAYWDTEIKHAQTLGLDDYPVFTRKTNSDLSFLACAQKLLDNRDVFYPMLATHNAHSIAAVLDMAGDDHSGFEFQRLYGMGEGLYDMLLERDMLDHVRIYAPVGGHGDLLPYLVRRLLENGANNAFVNRVQDPDTPVEKLIADPVADARNHDTRRHPQITMPADLYQPARANSPGINLDDPQSWQWLKAEMDKARQGDLKSCAVIDGQDCPAGAGAPVVSPADTGRVLGTVYADNMTWIEQAFVAARQGQRIWAQKSAQERAAVLEKLADRLGENMPALMRLSVDEGGRTIADARDEVREAIDFCRYYAAKGRKLFHEEGITMPGPTGERNTLTFEPKGVFVCISPWNFPLAIFTGQIAAALMAGNAVIAKPAEQTPLCAYEIVRLMLEAGVNPGAITLMPGGGDIGAALVEHDDVAGVAFTGSHATAKAINRTLAAKEGAIPPLIAETGGLNAMIADSSALPEQLVDDVVTSAFGSAGQRCSAARMLFVQEDIADHVLTMLGGAIAELRLGDPADLATDIGPVIDADSRALLEAHKDTLKNEARRKIGEAALPGGMERHGHFVAPAAYELNRADWLEEEIFGPVLHVVRYAADEIDQVVEAINNKGYGLTFGVHSRVDAFCQDMARRINAGNIYVNRGITGSVVESQPFGGRGLSGTGPKAGGPNYLTRFAEEKAVSINTTAQGGNASLVMMGEG